MKTYRLSTFMRNTSPFPTRKVIPSSSWNPGPPPAGSDGGGSHVYRHALKFQRPTTVPWQEKLANKASFIGLVSSPLMPIPTIDGRFGVSTFLSVQESARSGRRFWLRLRMWDKMAEISRKHLMPEDLVYVSGPLGSYKRASESGKPITCYEVIVKELNYVAPPCRVPALNSGESRSDVTSSVRREDHLCLWQTFFANPCEWWDNRKKKLHPRQPDFKHKDTGEALWLIDDPPWIRRQLELLDSKMGEGGLVGNVSSHRRVSPWVYDE